MREKSELQSGSIVADGACLNLDCSLETTWSTFGSTFGARRKHANMPGEEEHEKNKKIDVAALDEDGAVRKNASTIVRSLVLDDDDDDEQDDHDDQ